MTSSYICADWAKAMTSKPYWSLMDSAKAWPSVPVLTADPLALEVLVAGDLVVVLCHGHLDAGLEVRVGEVEDLLTFFGDGHTGDHAVHLVGLQRLKGSVEAEGTDFHREALVFGDRVHQVDVDADQFAVLAELEGREGCVRTDGVSLAGRLTGAGEVAAKAPDAGIPSSSASAASREVRGTASEAGPLGTRLPLCKVNIS